MTQENVEVVRTLLEGFAHRQHERAFDLYDPEIEWDASRMVVGLPDAAGVYHGHEGVRLTGGTGFRRGATSTSSFRMWSTRVMRWSR